MKHYLYDGTFEGLFSVIYETFHQRTVPDRICRIDQDEPNLFAEKINLTTNSAHAAKVEEAIRSKISTDALKHIFYAYLSEMDGAETAIFHYTKLGFQVGARVDRYLSHEWVMKVHRASQKVGKECHLMLGLLRFQKLQSGIYYAPMEPDHNILCLIAPHFKNRLADQNWIIHDLKRNQAAMFNQQEWMILDVPAEVKLTYAEDEELYQALWQGFFDSIAIESRINPILQRQHMPARYWRHLVEKIGTF